MNGIAAHSVRKLEYADIGNLSRRGARACRLCSRGATTASNYDFAR